MFIFHRILLTYHEVSPYSLSSPGNSCTSQINATLWEYFRGDEVVSHEDYGDIMKISLFTGCLGASWASWLLVEPNP